MRRLLPAAFVLLASCGPVPLWHKAGVGAAALQDDLTACRLRAAQSVPPNIQLRTTPIVTTPVETSCFQSGGRTQCVTTGGQVSGGQTYSVDTNESLRQDVVAQCMGRLGYQPVSLPRCPSGTPAAVPTGPQPPLTEASCAARTPGGDWRILNPA